MGGRDQRAALEPGGRAIRQLLHALAVLCAIAAATPATALTDFATFELSRFQYRPTVKTLSPRATARQLYRSKVLAKGTLVAGTGGNGVDLTRDVVRVSFGDFVQEFTPADFSATASGVRRFKGSSLNGLRTVILRPSGSGIGFVVLGTALRIAAPELFTLQIGDDVGQWDPARAQRQQPVRSVLVGQVIGGEPPDGLRRVAVQSACPAGECRELTVDGRFRIEARVGPQDLVIDGAAALDQPHARTTRRLDLAAGTTDLGIIALPALDLAQAREAAAGVQAVALSVSSSPLPVGGAAQVSIAAAASLTLPTGVSSPAVVSVTVLAPDAMPMPFPDTAWSPAVVAVQPEGATIAPCGDLRLPNPFPELGDGSVVDIYAAGSGATGFAPVGIGTVDGTAVVAPGVVCETGWFFAACPAAVTEIIGRVISDRDPVAGVPVYVDGAVGRTVEAADLNADGVAENFRLSSVAASCAGRPNRLSGISRRSGPGFALAGGINGLTAVENGLSDAGAVELGIATCGTKLGEWTADFIFPQDVAVGPDGAIYVSDLHHHSVAVFDAGGQFLRRFGHRGSGPGEFEHGPTGVAVAPDGSVYAIDQTTARIHRFDPQGRFDRIVGGEEYAELTDLATDGAGNLYVLISSPTAGVRILDANGTLLRTWGEEGSGPGQLFRPMEIALAPDGTVLVADTGNHRLQRFDGNGNLIASLEAQGDGPGQLGEPRAVTVDPTGTIYVADYHAGDSDLGIEQSERIQKLDADFGFLAQWGGEIAANPGRFAGIAGLATDSAGNLFVLDRRLQQFDPSGALTNEIGSFIWLLRGLAVDPDGNLEGIDSDSLNDRIITFSPDGTVLRRWGPVGEHLFDLTRRGIDVDAAGSVYVADYGRCAIQKFDRAGTLVAEWGSEGPGPGQFGPPCNGLKEVDADDRGHVYVYDSYRRQMTVFDDQGQFLAAWDGNDGVYNDGFSLIYGPAADGRGFVYVGEATSRYRRIRKFDESGRQVAVWSEQDLGPGRFPSGQFHLAADAQGNVYAAEVVGRGGGAARVFIYDTLGNYLGHWSVPDDIDPGAPTYLYGIELDGRGHVYLLDSNNRVLKYGCPG